MRLFRNPVFFWRIGLGIAGLLFLLILVFGDKPWSIVPVDAGKLRVREYAAIYSWWAALGNLAVVLALIVICPWWARSPERFASLSKIAAPRWFWPVVLFAMVVCGAVSLPRLTQSFWDDEELTMRFSIVGRYVTDAKSGEIRFRPVTWQDVFFDYRTPNNHVLHSVLAKTCHDIWKGIAKPKGLPFEEWVTRVPAWIFGILAVGALAWMLKDFGFAGAGAIAAVLLAIHPWHLRYASEARGYSMVLFFMPLLLVFWRRAMAQGGWQWWGAFGLVEFLMIYTYPGVLFILVTLNGFSVLAFLGNRVLLPRWFCVNALAAIPVIQLMLPLYPQMKIYMAEESARKAVLGWAWVESALAHLLGGAPWISGSPEYPSVSGWLQGPASFLLVALAVILVIVGAVRLARAGLAGWALLAVTVVPAAITFALSRLGGYIIYVPYVITALPGLVACAGIGIFIICQALGKAPAGRLVAPAFGVLVIGGFALLTQPVRGWLAGNSIQLIRESVALTRSSWNPLAPENAGILTASFCIPPYLYDGGMIRADSVGQFIELLRQSDREAKPLFVNIGMPWAAREYSPGMWALFQDERLFEEVAYLHGFDSGLDRIVARYRPGSAATYDFGKYSGEAAKLR